MKRFERERQLNENLKLIIGKIENKHIEEDLKGKILPINYFTVENSIDDLSNLVGIIVENDGFTDKRIIILIINLITEMSIFLGREDYLEQDK